MRLQVTLTAIALVALVTVAMAQLEEGDTSRWQFSTNLSLRLNTGNVERMILTPEANVAHVHAKKRWGFAARQRYTYGTFGELRTENDLLSRNFVYITPERRFYPYVMAWFQTHARQKLGFRYQVGPGVTYQPMKKHRHILKLSATFTHEHNWYTQAALDYIEDQSSREYSVFRVTGRIFGSHTFADGAVSIYHELLFQQATNQAENWRVFAEGGIHTRVIGGFSMRSYLNFEYQQVHVSTEKPDDLILNIGLNYKVSSKR